MKRLFLLLVALLVIPLTGCRDLKNNIEAGIGALKLNDYSRCENCSIKFLDDRYSPVASYFITPSGFEMDKLDEMGYMMKIMVSYTVYYTKSYDVLWDIGYAGAPKYEVSISDDTLTGNYESDIKTTKNKASKSIYIDTYISNIKNRRWSLNFSTDNIQNVVHFEDIYVTYTCHK